MVVEKLILEFRQRPSTLAYMLRAFRPSHGLKKAGRFPAMRAVWRRMQTNPRELEEFLRLTGLGTDQGMPMLYPHVAGFRLQMAILTHPAFPIPIWGALQIRNHLLQHRPISGTAALDLETRVAGQRILEKGAEVDLHTTVRERDELMWESLNTFYYRGRFGEQGLASPLARAPQSADAVIARWRTLSGVGRRFGRMTGDYNGIHLWHWYARAFGFRQAFHHPQLVLGQCMARLPARDTVIPQRLDAWLKGPVYCDIEVTLRAAIETKRAVFSLTADGEDRPAVVGLRSTCPAGSRLLDEHDRPV